MVHACCSACASTSQTSVGLGQSSRRFAGKKRHAQVDRVRWHRGNVCVRSRAAEWALAHKVAHLQCGQACWCRAQGVAGTAPAGFWPTWSAAGSAPPRAQPLQGSGTCGAPGTWSRTARRAATCAGSGVSPGCAACTAGSRAPVGVLLLKWTHEPDPDNQVVGAVAASAERRVC